MASERPADESARIYVAAGSGNPIYHTDDDCPQIDAGTPAGETGTVDVTTRDQLRERDGQHYRECDRCRYRGLPALEDAPPAGRGQVHVLPWAVGLAAVAIVLGLFVGVLGGAL